MSGITVIDSIGAMRQAASGAKALGDLALVPTMGALHEGHLSLVRAAKERCRTVVASIFVNPTQFGEGEDLARYPRNLSEDVKLLEQEGVELVFAPSVEEMYPHGTITSFVDVPGVADRLDGRSRPGHFRGVATVVAKLFNIVSPNYAFFGQKDAAQVAVLRTMVRDLNFSTEIIACPTVREPDGLAMSSRNEYLSGDERVCARVLSEALRKVHEAAARGANDASELRNIMLNTIQCGPQVRLDYAEIVDPDTLLPLDDCSRGALVAIAAWINETRLIDNVLLSAAEVTRCA